MGLYDRDWWRDRRKNLHPDDPRSWPVGDTRTGPRRASPGPSWGTIFLVAIVVFGAYVVLDRFPPTARLFAMFGGTADKSGTARSEPLFGCNDGFPEAGTSYLDSDWKSRGGAVAATRVVNNTQLNRVVDLKIGDRVLMSIAAPAGRVSTVEIPVGRHAWQLRTGKSWCASTATFIQEHRTIVDGALVIVGGREATVYIEPDERQPSGFALRTM